MYIHIYIYHGTVDQFHIHLNVFHYYIEYRMYIICTFYIICLTSFAIIMTIMRILDTRYHYERRKII